MSMRRRGIMAVAAGALVSAFVFCGAAAAFNSMGVPKLAQYVEDFAAVLKPEDLASLRATAEAYQRSTGRQAVSVVIPDRDGRELFDVAMKIFSDNKIGDAWRNDGILLVVAANEKKIRIVTGYGLEGEIPDAVARDIIEKDVRPSVDAGDVAGGIRGFYRRLGASAASAGTGAAPAVRTVSGYSDDVNIPWGFGLITGPIAWLAMILLRGRLEGDGFGTWPAGVAATVVLAPIALMFWTTVPGLSALTVAGFVIGFYYPKGPIIVRVAKTNLGRSGRSSGGGGRSGGGGGFSGGGGRSGGGGAGD